MPMNTPLPVRLKAETRYSMEQKKIDRINFLARKEKSEGLTEEEKQEQHTLRREYVEAYKKSLISQLENMYIVEPDGTKKKVKPKDETHYN